MLKNFKLSNFFLKRKNLNLQTINAIYVRNKQHMVSSNNNFDQKQIYKRVKHLLSVKDNINWNESFSLGAWIDGVHMAFTFDISRLLGVIYANALIFDVIINPAVELENKLSEFLDVNHPESKCQHQNKRKSQTFNGEEFWYCPDCKEEV
jgi:hypothetical protein